MRIKKLGIKRFFIDPVEGDRKQLKVLFSLPLSRVLDELLHLRKRIEAPDVDSF